MKKGLTIFLALVAVAAIIFGAISFTQKGDLQKQVDELNAQAAKLSAELADTQKQLESAKDEAAKAVEAAKAAEEAAKAAEEAKAAAEAAKAAEEAKAAAEAAKAAEEAKAAAEAAKAAEGAKAAEEAKAANAPAKVGVLVPVMTHGWVSGITYQAEAYAKELAAAGKIEYKSYTSSNAEEMTAQIDEAILWGAQILVIAPQWTGMEAPVQDAIDKGLIVVAFDMDIDANGILKVTGDNKSMGVAGAKFIVDKVGAEAVVIALPVPTSGSVSELRMAGFKETIAEIAPNLKVIEYATKFTREDGLKDFADILQANPHIDAVYSLDDETSIGVLQAIADAGRTDIKAITGGGGCQEYFQLIAENKDIAVSSSLYSPLMIRDCFDVALAKLAGEEVQAVTVIPSQIVDASNVEQYLDPSNTIY